MTEMSLPHNAESAKTMSLYLFTQGDSSDGNSLSLLVTIRHSIVQPILLSRPTVLSPIHPVTVPILPIHTFRKITGFQLISQSPTLSTGRYE